MIHYFRTKLKKLRNSIKTNHFTVNERRMLRRSGIIVPYYKGQHGHGYKLAPDTEELIFSHTISDEIP